jgi:uncharacterized protein (DUF433 family)
VDSRLKSAEMTTWRCIEPLSATLPWPWFALAPALPVAANGRTLPSMLDWSQCHAVERTPGKVSGAWVFKGTRVPVTALFENLEDGASVDEFVQWFPGVSREQVHAVLNHAARSLVAA